MKKILVILAIGIAALCIYLLGYYSARKDHILVRRLNVTYGPGGTIIRTYNIVPGNYGPGKGGILVSPAEIQFCYIVFSPLRVIEAKYRE